MNTTFAALVAAVTSFIGVSQNLVAQLSSIAGRVEAVREGTVSMRFAARPGVCGDGDGSTWTRGASSDSWRRNCITGPVYVVIGRADNSTVSVRISIGDGRRGSSETDLGFVSAPDGARYLAEIARGLGGRNASEAVSGAALADSVDLAPELTSLVRDQNVTVDTRQQALFWLGQTAISTANLSRLYDDLARFALREHFVFVISQRRDDPSVEKLIDIASHDADHEIRKRAMFWLGQTNSPRAVKFLRDLVTR
jgi:hypothetical protein